MSFDEGSDDGRVSPSDASRRHKAEQARVRRNKRSGLEFEEEMFSRSSRYLLLHITVNYKKHYREDVTLKTIQRHRDIFIRHLEDYEVELLQGVCGLIWKLEEGARAGLHLHLLVFYRGDCRRDVQIAQSLGDYWERVITKGWGDYWNSNADKKRLKYRWGVGIGQVNRLRDAKRVSLQLFIENYMAKSNQVPSERGEDDRLFGARDFTRRRI